MKKTMITRALAFEHMYPPNLSPIPHLDDFWAKMLYNMATGDHFPDMCGCHDNTWHSSSENFIFHNAILYRSCVANCMPIGKKGRS